ncbi:pyridoxal phosphate-dependent aminotransferase [Candidatus Margulisiibacteriota bacterium]
MFVNKYVKRLKPYALVSHKAWERIYDENILKLDWNEATVPPSPLVSKNILQFLEAGKLNWYPDVNNHKLLQSIASYNDIDLLNIQYFASSDSLQEYIVRSYIEEGDKVVIVSPTYDNFRASAESLGADICYFGLDEQFRLDFRRLTEYLENISPKIVYICNPNNPTGTIHESNKLEELVENFQSILFIIDEAYYEFCGVSMKHIVKENKNVIITRTFSKAFALASFRIGYAISSEQNIKILDKVRNAKNINTLSQIAAIAALTDIAYMQNYVQEVNNSKAVFVENLKRLDKTCFEVFSGGGNFVFLKLKPADKVELIDCFESHNIFVRNFSHMPDLSNFIRISVGVSSQMDKVFNVIEDFYNKK